MADLDGGAILVDCGSAGHPTLTAALVHALRETPWRPSDISQLILTHYHSDHAGLAASLVEQSGCQVLGHPAVEHFTDGTTRPEEIAAARRQRAWQEGVPDGLLDMVADVTEELIGIDAPLVPDVALAEGDRIPSALGVWEVIETPGHAPTHLCLFQQESGILIAGDLVAPGYFPYFDYGYTQDPVAEYFLSLEKVDDLNNVTMVLPGHGRPIDDLHATVAMWQRELAGSVRRLEDAVRNGATNVWEATVAAYAIKEPNRFAVLWYGEALSLMRHLRARGLVVRSTGSDGRFQYRHTSA